MAGQNTDLFCPQCRHYDMRGALTRDKCIKGHWRTNRAWPLDFMHLVADTCEDYEDFIYDLHAPRNRG